MNDISVVATPQSKVMRDNRPDRRNKDNRHAEELSYEHLPPSLFVAISRFEFRPGNGRAVLDANPVPSVDNLPQVRSAKLAFRDHSFGRNLQMRWEPRSGRCRS